MKFLILQNITSIIPVVRPEANKKKKKVRKICKIYKITERLHCIGQLVKLRFMIVSVKFVSLKKFISTYRMSHFPNLSRHSGRQ